MVDLLFTTHAFAPHGLPLPGVPMLLDREMRLIEPACAWLLYIALVRGRTRSRQTWRTYGEVLYDWWQTLEANSWAWDEVGTREIAAYRDHMLQHASGHTGRPYARSTVNGRLRILSLFYRWCVGGGLIDHAPFQSSELALGRLPARRISRPCRRERGCPDGQRSDRTTSRGAAAAAGAGIDPAHHRRYACPKSADRRMGGDDRCPPHGDSRDPAEHAAEGRRAADDGGAHRRDQGGQSAARLSSVAAAGSDLGLRARGAGIGRSTRQGAGSLLCRARQAVPDRKGRCTDAAAHRRDVCRCRRAGGITAHFHALRHTFASVMLRFLQRQAAQGADLNPLLTLQTLLGHADLATTSIYLRVVATDLSVIETSVDELYEALL